MSSTTGTPMSPRWPEGPIPDSIRSFGDPIAPLVTIISWLASARSSEEVPSRRYSTARARPFSTTTRGPQVGHRRAASPAVTRRRLMVSDAFLLGAVEVRIVGYANLLGGLDESGGDLDRADRVGHR